jgi:hypothetical protein
MSSCVRWQKIMYSPGLSLFSSMMRRLAVSRSVAGSTHTGIPSESFLKMSYGDGIASVTLSDTADFANQVHTCIYFISVDLSKWFGKISLYQSTPIHSQRLRTSRIRERL